MPPILAALSLLIGGVAAVSLNLTRSGWSPRAEAALLGVWLTVMACSGMLLLRTGLLTAVRNDPLLHLPASDDLMFAWRWRSVSRHRWFYFWFVLVSFYYLGRHLETPLRSLGIAVVLAALAAHALVCFELLFWTPISRVQNAGCIPTLVLLVGTIALTFFPSPWLANFLNSSAPELNLVHPGGWIVGLWTDLTEGAGIGHLLIYATPLLALLGSYPYSRIWIRKKFDPGAMLERLIPPSPPELAEVKKNILTSPEESVAQVRAAWREETLAVGALERVQASPAGVVSQLVQRRLTARERLITGLFFGSIRNYELWLLRACKFLGIAFVVAGVAYFEGFQEASVIILCCAGLFTLLAGGNPKFSGAARFAGLLPLSFREIEWLCWKLGAPTYVLLVLPLGLLGLAGGYFAHLDLIRAGIAGAKAALVVLAGYPLAATVNLSAYSRDTVITFRNLPLIGAWMVSTVVVIAGLGTVFIPGPIAWLVLVLVALWSRAMLGIYSRAWSRRRFDLNVS